MPPTRNLPALAALLALCGCRSPMDAVQVEPTSLGLYVGDVHVNRQSSLGLLPGTTLQFSVRLTDASGRAVTGLHANIVSRSTQTLTFDAENVIHVVGRGSSWVVGSVLTPGHAVLADSTQVQVVCTVAAQPAITLTVVDSATGQSGGLRSVNITIREGGLRDTIFVSSIAAGAPPFTVGMAFERTGTYDLTATAAGYQLWSRSGVVVTRDLCHVVTVPITARLQPL